MTAFPDTSFICSIYRTQSHSIKADAYMESSDRPLMVSSLLLLEFRQSVRLQARLFSLDRTKGYPQAEGERMLRNLQVDLGSGLLQSVVVDWSDVHRIAENLSGRYTRERGHRFADLLHVATALHLGSPEFLTFYANQRALAEAEGMSVPLG